MTGLVCAAVGLVALTAITGAATIGAVRRAAVMAGPLKPAIALKRTPAEEAARFMEALVNRDEACIGTPPVSARWDDARGVFVLALGDEPPIRLRNDPEALAAMERLVAERVREHQSRPAPQPACASWDARGGVR